MVEYDKEVVIDTAGAVGNFAQFILNIWNGGFYYMILLVAMLLIVMGIIFLMVFIISSVSKRLVNNE